MKHHVPAQGFTLVETMVAITILAFALVGPFTAVQTALSNSYLARDQLTAASLAQEAQEYIISIRDNNYLATPRRGWLDGFNSATQGRNRCYGAYNATVTGFCTVDPTLGDFHVSGSASAMVGYTSAQASSIVPLYISSGNMYQQTAVGTRSKFTRTVRIQELTNTNDEVRVTVVVSWTTANKPYSITVVNTLRDWL